MSEYKDFDYDFIERTLAILENYKGEYDVTNLINCAVGLIIIPKEKYYYEIPSIKLMDLESSFGIQDSTISFLDYENETRYYNLRNLIRHLRNAIAHGRLKQKTVKEGEIESINFCDVDRNDIQTFEATFVVDELRKFSIAIGKFILDNKSKQGG